MPLPGQIASDASPCGTPKDGDGGTDPEGLLCDDCVAMSRGWDRACATMVYAGTGRRLVLMLKHGDRLDLLPALGAWLARSAQPLIQPDTVIVPIPMHLTRQMKRKYNQAALLGRCVARAYGRDWHPDLLYRTRQGAMQGKASLIQRFRNQDGAIAARADRVAALEGRPVLLVDDVMASGATMMAAATALRSAGVGQISVLALARAVKPA